MSEYPRHWTNCLLGERVQFQYGKSPNEVRGPGGKYPVYGSSGKTAEATNFTTNSPSIIVGRKGTIDKPIYLAEKCWAIDTTFFVDDFPLDEPKYLFYLLDSINLKSLNESTGVPSLSRDALHSISASLPPLPEQKKIAEILSGVDFLIKSFNNLIAKQVSLKKAMTLDLMSHGAESKELKDSEPGKIPLDWEVRPLGSVFTLASGKSKPKSLLSSMVTDGEKIPVYGGNGITGYASDYLLDLPTIAIGRVGEYCGAVHLTPNMSWVTDNALYIKDKLLDFDLPFMYHFLAFCEISKMRKQGGQPLISQKPILDLIVALPPIEEQRQIALILDSISKSISLLETRRQRIIDLKDSVSQDLLSGRKRVTL